MLSWERILCWLRPRYTRVTVEHLLHRFRRAAFATAQSWVRSSLTRVRSSSTRQDSRGSRAGEHRRPMSRLNAPSDSFLMGCPSNRHRSVSLYRGCVDLGRRRLWPFISVVQSTMYSRLHWPAAAAAAATNESTLLPSHAASVSLPKRPIRLIRLVGVQTANNAVQYCDFL